MATRSRFVGVRLEPEQYRKLVLLSVVAGEPGNVSEAARYLVDRLVVDGQLSVTVEPSHARQAQPEQLD